MPSPLAFSPDGVFRAAGPGSRATAGMSTSIHHGLWTVSVDLAGEMYQAHFAFEEDAEAAFIAVGGIPT